MFIKRGGSEGKILSVVNDEELTPEQKKAADELAKKSKQSDIADTSNAKKSES